jgi:hypothetical protein
VFNGIRSPPNIVLIRPLFGVRGAASMVWIAAVVDALLLDRATVMTTTLKGAPRTF